MIGKLDPSSKDVTIVGAGIAGLLAGYYLDRAGFRVTIHEAAPRAGGLIATRRHPLGISETAAHSLLATPAVRALCQELGVELAEVRKSSRARYIYRDGRLRKFPLKVTEAIAAFFRAYFLLSPRSDPRTLEEWGRRFLGQPAVSYLLSPFVRGIYGARPSELSVSAAFPALRVPRGHSLVSFLLARWRKAPPKEGRRTMVAPSQGMESLVQALTAKLAGKIRLGSELRELPRDGANNILVCVPAAAAARLLREQDPELSRLLDQVGYTPLVSVTAFMEKSAFSRPVSGVGVLLPEGESKRLLGILFNSSSFPGRVGDESRMASFTAMLGGTSAPELVQESDEKIQDELGREFRRVLGAKGAPVHCEVSRWNRAVPIYDSRLEQAWAAARLGWCSRPGRILFGNYTGQVSLRGMIESASQLAAGLHTSIGDGD